MIAIFNILYIFPKIIKKNYNNFIKLNNYYA
jgi:hypothetical protein